MNFENQDIRVIVPMDPDEGKRYIKLVKDEVVKGWDHAYNIYKYYIKPIDDGDLGWCNAISTSSDFDDALKNWQNRMHEVSFRKCVSILQCLHHVATKIVEFPVYEGLPKIYAFLELFKERVSEPQ